MSWNPGTGIWPASHGKGKSEGIYVEPASSHSFEGQTTPAEMETGILASHSEETVARDDPRVVAALEAYLDALRSGRAWSRTEFLAQHFEISDVLDQCLSGLEFVHAAAVQLEQSHPVSAGDLASAIPHSARLGDYRILREIGRGGMGVVYEAEQISLSRHVALKVLPFAAAIDPKQRQRFQIEAQAAAQLHHPHIVPIFSVGCDHGIHYYAMQFVEGRSLAAVLQELRHGTNLPGGAGEAQSAPPNLQSTDDDNSSATKVGNQVLVQAPAPPDLATAPPIRLLLSSSETTSVPGPTTRLGSLSLSATTVGPIHHDGAFCRNIARLGVEAAEALEHAHSLGILHRDIKPANLMIDPHGALWITDFGLALFPSDLSLTHTGDIVGTLRYMSPEQALARRGVVDQRSDVYSLGATLYELLTLKPAFDGRDHQELLRQIALDEPVRPRRLNPAIPRDLETIVLKAMAKDPAVRYTTAADLAADIKRFLEDRPILARRPNPVELSLRWAFRHRELVATTTAIIVLALIVGTAAIWVQSRKTQDANGRHHAYIIETFPLLDGLSMASLGQATKYLTDQPDEPVGSKSLQAYQRTLNVYNHASNLPPADVESRVIIARAYNRLGFTRAVWSRAKGSKGTPDFSLIAQAEADYRRSHMLFAELYEQFPDDPKVRRGFADALGLWGWGWYLYYGGRPREAEPHYQKAVKLWRSLVRDAGTKTSASTGSAPGPETMTSDLSDMYSLGDAVHTLAELLEARGQVKEADGLRQQLDDDVAVLAERFSSPARRQYWVGQFMDDGIWSLKQDDRLTAALNFRMATILGPDHAEAHNSLAWTMASVPGKAPFQIKRAVTSAQQAVALAPKNWMYWNTLGVAAVRAKDWKTADESLRKSMSLNSGGGAIDFFFLAMTRWHRGNPDEAQKLFKQGAEYLKHNPGDHELNQFYKEAKDLLSQPCPKSNPESHEHECDNDPTDTAQQ